MATYRELTHAELSPAMCAFITGVDARLFARPPEMLELLCVFKELPTRFAPMSAGS